MLEFRKPIPVNTPHGEGYAIYVESGGMFENDCWTVCLCEGGVVRHYNTTQINICKNGTFEIYEKEKSKTAKKDGTSNSRRQAASRSRKSI